mmetsp:Transcript_93450/g.285977  ORF Transcript_93450/g.285977 Transcript_93450/m.285977 type:complete len:219 (+) Transcript_93450:515-1171(+)
MVPVPGFPLGAEGLVDEAGRLPLGRGAVRRGCRRRPSDDREFHVHLQPGERREGLRRERPRVRVRPHRCVLCPHGLDRLRRVRPRAVAIHGPAGPRPATPASELFARAHRVARAVQLVLDFAAVRSVRGDVHGPIVQKRWLLFAAKLAQGVQGRAHRGHAFKLLLVARGVHRGHPRRRGRPSGEQRRCCGAARARLTAPRPPTVALARAAGVGRAGSR